VGIAGGPEKCRTVVDDLGFDACLDYKAGDLSKGLRREAPDGVHVYFDNVGGEVLDAVLPRLALHGCVVLCGAISQYNADGRMTGPSNYMSLLVNRARMEGFVIFDFAKRYGEGVARLSEWLRSGELRSREHVVEADVEEFPEVLLGLFRGENRGKLVMALPLSSSAGSATRTAG
jgi:NADPH-dependent curcumin reductase CurA